jgi:hypothetical protein
MRTTDREKEYDFDWLKIPAWISIPVCIIIYVLMTGEW